MDQDDEEKEFGTSTNIPDFKISGNIFKEKQKEKVNTFNILTHTY